MDSKLHSIPYLISNFIFGLGALLLAFYFSSLFPYEHSAMYLGLVGIAVLCAIVPHIWLYVIPLLTINVNLAPSTGRAIIGELDIFLLVFAAVLLFRRELIHTVSKKSLGFIVVLFVVLFSTVNFGHLQELGSPINTNYFFSSWYGFSVTKGIFWAGILALYLQSELNRDRSRAIYHLLLSSCLSSLALFLVVLWERLFISGLLNGQSLNELMKLFFDFGTSYRVTGLVSDMHTGGESLDGVFLILAPLNLAALLFYQGLKEKLISAAALMAILYCVMVGFTRATYGAVAFGLLVLTILFFFSAKDNESDGSLKIKQSLIALALFTCAIIVGQYTGVRGPILLSVMGAFFLVAHGWKLKSTALQWIILSAVTLLSTGLLLWSHANNSWVQSSFESSSLLVVSTLVFALLLHLGLKKNIIVLSTLKSQFIAAAVLLITTSIVVTAVGGSRMQKRFQQITGDLNQRFEHWQIVLDSSDDSFATKLIGNGIGTFPYNYLKNDPDLVKRVGSFAVDNNVSPHLVLGPGNDLAFGQRVKVVPGVVYKLKGLYKTPETVRIRFELCERNNIVFEKWGIKCKKANERLVQADDWQTFEYQLDAKNLGEGSVLERHQPTFLIRYKEGNENILFKELQLVDEYGFNILKNGDFSLGMDYWFFYHDFEHLPWHIKNIYLSTYYQFGIFGCLAALAMCWIIAKNVYSSTDTLRPLYLGVGGVIAAYLAFGFFGDPLDSPRTNMLFYFLFFTVLTNLKGVSTAR